MWIKLNAKHRLFLKVPADEFFKVIEKKNVGDGYKSFPSGRRLFTAMSFCSHFKFRNALFALFFVN